MLLVLDALAIWTIPSAHVAKHMSAPACHPIVAILAIDPEVAQWALFVAFEGVYQELAVRVAPPLLLTAGLTVVLVPMAVDAVRFRADGASKEVLSPLSCEAIAAILGRANHEISL